MAELAACYCFKNGREYIYIGQAGVLRDRIKQHEKKTYFTYANAVRIIIPRYKRQLNQIERLLILAHHPSENGTAGIVGKTPVDDCLEFIRGEIKELITDFLKAMLPQLKAALRVVCYGLVLTILGACALIILFIFALLVGPG